MADLAAGQSVAERTRMAEATGEHAPPAPGRFAVAVALLGVVALLGLLAYGLFGRGQVAGGALGVNSTFGAVAVRTRPAPDIALPLFTGETFRLSQVRGDVVVLDFWASWCVPCREEAPVLERAWQRYRGQGVRFVGVNTLGDAPATAREFLARYGVSYANGQDPKGAIAVEFGVTGIPEKFFIDRDGQVVRKFIGPMPEAALVAVLEELLSR